LKLTRPSVRHEASRGLSATVERVVHVVYAARVRTKPSPDLPPYDDDDSRIYISSLAGA